MTEKIRILMVKRGNMSDAELARRINISPQNLSNKFKRDNFSERELTEIAEALNCELNINFKMKDTNEII